MPTALYIHGFASTGTSSKVDQVRAILEPETVVLAPTLTHNPREDFEVLKRLVVDHGVRTVVGSSLGGFYALALGQLFDLRVVLINPAIHAYDTLSSRVGTVPVYGTDRAFEWTAAKLDELREIGTLVSSAISLPDSGLTWPNVLTLLGAQDDVVDPTVSAHALRMGRVIVDPSENHRFDVIYKYAEAIRLVDKSSSDPGVLGDILC